MESIINYINLLEANKNLVLTGAPGTGKTYLAKKIAESMEANVEFVQFHSSYNYTDFVDFWLSSIRFSAKAIFIGLCEE